MEKRKSKWVSWLVWLTLIAVLGISLWYGYNQGWLAVAYNQLTQGHAGKSEHDRMGMNMPGMSMGSPQGGSATASSVPGHALVTIAPEGQQRIGVRIGKVVRDKLRMTIRPVGIVEPDQTRLTRVHTRISGWVTKVHVNFVGESVRKGDPLLEIYSPDLVTSVGRKLASFPECLRILITSDMPLFIRNAPPLPNPGHPIDRKRLLARSLFAPSAFAEELPPPLTSYPACFLRLHLAA